MPTPRVRGPCCNPTIEQKEYVGSRPPKYADAWKALDSSEWVNVQEVFLQEWTAEWEQRSKELLDIQYQSIVDILRDMRSEMSSAYEAVLPAARKSQTGNTSSAALADKVAELSTMDAQIGQELKSNGLDAIMPMGDAPTTRDVQGMYFCPNANIDTTVSTKAPPKSCGKCEQVFDIRPCMVPPLNASSTPYIKRQLDLQKQQSNAQAQGEAAFNLKPKRVRKSRRMDQSDTAEFHEQSIQVRCVNFVECNAFKLAAAGLIISNTCFSGYQTDVTVVSAFADQDPPSWFNTVDFVFCMGFTFELVVRITAYRCDFLCAEEWKWNLFDTTLVVSQYLEMAMGDNIDMSAIRVFRLARLVRTLRIIKVVPFFTKLRMMVCCIYNSLMSLMWSLVLLFLVMYLFSIICVQATINVISSSEPLSLNDYGDNLSNDVLREKLWTSYRTLPRALFSMLMAITGGADWYEMAQPLMCIHWFYGFLFAGFISFVIVGVLNVLSAVFVENALQIRDRDLLIQSQIEQSEGFVQDMAQLFNEADYNRNGSLTQAELAKYMRNERVVAYMQGYDLDVADFGAIFELMDQDGNGSVGLDEFVLGMMKLKGKARCLDVMRLFQCMDSIETHLSEIQLVLPQNCPNCGSLPRALAETAKKRKMAAAVVEMQRNSLRIQQEMEEDDADYDDDFEPPRLEQAVVDKAAKTSLRSDQM